MSNYARLRRVLWIALLTGGAVAAFAQAAQNPFELTPRLAAGRVQATPVPDSTTAPTPANSANPFELDRQGYTPPAPVNTPEATADRAAPHPTPSPATPSTTWLLALIVGNLLIFTLVFTFLRTLYTKAGRAVFNDNLLTQLYRERDANLLPFLIAYVMFFLSAAVFVFLMASHWNWLPALPPNYLLLGLALGLAGLFLLKHLALAFIGFVFPIAKETQLYSFTIMVFAIVIGGVLTPANLVLAYCPPEWRTTAIFTSLGLVGGLYLLRSLRGLFIANRFVFSHLLHFLLYIYALELMPVLLLYKLIVDKLY